MIALFGGTFNPVHVGHIALVREVASAFQLDHVQLVPSFIPVHREEPQIDPLQRLQMLKLATAEHAELRVNTCEIERGGPSYTVDTLAQLKHDDPQQTLCWLMGVDSFNSFSTWKQPDRILQLANLVICERPGTRLDRQQYASHFLDSHERLHDFDAGRIAVFRMQPNACSSTDVRQRLKAGKAVDRCLSPTVLDFIHKQHLYEN